MHDYATGIRVAEDSGLQVPNGVIIPVNGGYNAAGFYEFQVKQLWKGVSNPTLGGSGGISHINVVYQDYDDSCNDVCPKDDGVSPNALVDAGGSSYKACCVNGVAKATVAVKDGQIKDLSSCNSGCWNSNQDNQYALYEFEFTCSDSGGSDTTPDPTPPPTPIPTPVTSSCSVSRCGTNWNDARYNCNAACTSWSDPVCVSAGKHCYGLNGNDLATDLDCCSGGGGGGGGGGPDPTNEPTPNPTPEPTDASCTAQGNSCNGNADPCCSGLTCQNSGGWKCLTPGMCCVVYVF